MRRFEKAALALFLLGLVMIFIHGLLMAYDHHKPYTWQLVRINPLTGDADILDYNLSSEDCWNEKYLYESNDQPTAGLLSCEQPDPHG